MALEVHGAIMVKRVQIKPILDCPPADLKIVSDPSEIVYGGSVIIGKLVAHERGVAQSSVGCRGPYLSANRHAGTVDKDNPKRTGN